MSGSPAPAPRSAYSATPQPPAIHYTPEQVRAQQMAAHWAAQQAAAAAAPGAGPSPPPPGYGAPSHAPAAAPPSTPRPPTAPSTAPAPAVVGPSHAAPTPPAPAASRHNADPPAGSCPGGGVCNGSGGQTCCQGCPAFNNRIMYGTGSGGNMHKRGRKKDGGAGAGGASAGTAGGGAEGGGAGDDDAVGVMECANCGTSASVPALETRWGRLDCARTLSSTALKANDRTLTLSLYVRRDDAALAPRR